MSNLVNQLAADVRGVLGRVDGLASQVASMALENKALAAKQAQSSGGNSSSGGGIPPEVLAALEKKFMDRQARFEGALMQVARQVDVLDARWGLIRESHRHSLSASVPRACLYLPALAHLSWRRCFLPQLLAHALPSLHAAG